MPIILGENWRDVNSFWQNDFKKMQSFMCSVEKGAQAVFSYINYKRVRARIARILHKKAPHLAMCKQRQWHLCFLAQTEWLFRCFICYLLTKVIKRAKKTKKGVDNGGSL